jgi:uroporphyrinogen-III synthase
MPSTSTAFSLQDGSVDPLAGYVVAVFGTTGVEDVADIVSKQGAEVISAAVSDKNSARRLLDALAQGTVDGLALLDVAVAESVVGAVQRLRIGGALRTALRGRTLIATADSAAAERLAIAGITASTPIGRGAPVHDALAQLLIEQIPVLRGRHCVAASHELDVRSSAVVIDGELRRLPASAMALLRALAHQPGHVVTREKLLALLPGEKVSGHAVDVAIGRLRTALGDPAIIATVVKRGYRLTVA